MTEFARALMGIGAALIVGSILLAFFAPESI